MKLNKWTMALAAAGVVSLSSVAQAQEAVSGANALAASTTLSGYVSSHYSVNDDSTSADDDKFSLDVVDLKLASAQGAGEYATGYTVELWAGDDAGGLGTTGAGTVELYQANVDLRVPVGNGLDLKIGQFTTVVGAESLNRNENPFWNRSQGFDIEPTHHTGILGSYQMSDDLGIKLGLVNDTQNNTSNEDLGGTAYLVRVDYKLPESAGFLGGVGLSYGRVDGAGIGTTETDNQFFGMTVPLDSVTEGLSYSLAWDIQEYAGAGRADSNILGHYLSYGLNEKATVNVRYETGNQNTSAGANVDDGISNWTIGLDYKLWENVISRVEYMSRDSDTDTSSTDSLTFNIIYSF